MDFDDRCSVLVVALEDGGFGADEAEEVVAGSRARRIAVAGLDDAGHTVVGAEHAHPEILHGSAVRGVGHDGPHDRDGAAAGELEKGIDAVGYLDGPAAAARYGRIVLPVRRRRVVA